MSLIIDLIKNQDKEHWTKYRKLFSQTIDYNDKPNFVCPSCGSETKNIDSYLLCDKCGEFNENHLIIGIESACKNYTFDVESCEDLASSNTVELCKIKVETMFGLALLGLVLETNEWSSAPHDDYITKILLFNTFERRDECYNKYMDRLAKLDNNKFYTLSREFEENAKVKANEQI